ncbi:MAG: hypothetical protein K0V04_18640 [Deltaproteobacteria bacterium]|nr:hypothetical protein [Deltaproteobacteria bacterium]
MGARLNALAMAVPLSWMLLGSTTARAAVRQPQPEPDFEEIEIDEVADVTPPQDEPDDGRQESLPPDTGEVTPEPDAPEPDSAQTERQPEAGEPRDQPSTTSNGDTKEEPSAAEVDEPSLDATGTGAAVDRPGGAVSPGVTEPVEVGASASEVVAGPPLDAQPIATATPRSALQSLSEHVHVGGFIQVDYLRRQISEDELSAGDRAPLNENAFVLRNARFGLDADWRYVGATASAELFSNGGSVRPAAFDVHAQLPGKAGAPPWVQLRAGLLRVPFGFEIHDQNDAQRFFGERTEVSHAFVPGLFDVGASLSGQVWALRWIVAVQNGQPVGAPGFGYRDPNAAKDYAGRLHLRGQALSWLDAAIGFSFLSGRGFSAGTAPTKDSFDWVDLNEDGRVTVAELIPVAGSAGRASSDFRRWGLGADTQLRAAIPRVGELMLYAELAVGQNLDRALAIADPVLLGRDQRGIGWYVGLTQQLTRHATVGVRYDDYRPDLDALEPFDGTVVITRRKFQTLTGSVAAYLHQGESIQARLLVEYQRQDNSLGRDERGRPDRLPNDTLRLRAEVVFR